MSRRGNCWDNAPQESFFGHMKDEINYRSCTTFEELKGIIDNYRGSVLKMRISHVKSIFPADTNGLQTF